MVRYVFAHRGGRGHGPDNTLATFQEALARGATGLETDAWLTADGAVVLDHDGVWQAARRRHEPIATARRAQLPSHVPTLDELYQRCGSAFELAIDVRLPEVAEAVVDVARRHQAIDRLWIVGATPALVTGWQQIGHTGRFAMSIRLLERRPAIVEAAATAGAHALNMRWPWWTRRWVQRVHDAGLLAFAYDVQWPIAMTRCRRLGIDGIFTDHLDRVE